MLGSKKVCSLGTSQSAQYRLGVNKGFFHEVGPAIPFNSESLET